MDIVDCIDVCKTFGDKTALDRLSIKVEPGSVFGLLGPNGSGKTTLIRIINRITIPSSGEVLFDGHPITRKDVSRIGYMPEERGLYRKMKVGEQAMYLSMLRGMSRSDAKRSLDEWFSRFGIGKWWDRKVEELSKGMAQKVQFITTVVHKPSLLILDEPFSGFDPVNADIIRRELLRLKSEGASIMLSTHNMESVEELCDSIALISGGRKILDGRVKDIRRRYGRGEVEFSYEASDGLHTETLPASEASSRVSALLAAGASLRSYRELVAGMNDIFIKLVKEGI